jgi:hypothetical protein
MTIRGTTAAIKPYLPTTSVKRKGCGFNNNLEKSTQKHYTLVDTGNIII